MPADSASKRSRCRCRIGVRPSVHRAYASDLSARPRPVQKSWFSCWTRATSLRSAAARAARPYWYTVPNKTTRQTAPIPITRYLGWDRSSMEATVGIVMWRTPLVRMIVEHNLQPRRLPPSARAERGRSSESTDQVSRNGAYRWHRPKPGTLRERGFRYVAVLPPNCYLSLGKATNSVPQRPWCQSAALYRPGPEPGSWRRREKCKRDKNKLRAR